MKLRTRRDTTDIPQVLHIPENIKKDIQDRGFHLYKWISPEEVKLSIQRDFLSVISKIGIPLAIISGLAGLLTGLNVFVFFFVIFIGIFLLFLYLTIHSLRRSLLLSKSAFVILTDSSVSLGGKIVKLSEISPIKKDIKKVSDTFEEELFGESRLAQTHASLTKTVMKQLFGGYEAIFQKSGRYSFGRDSDDIRLILVLITLYTLYIAIMASVYFIGVFFLLIFGNLLTWLNKKFLIYKGHNVLKINEIFGDIDTISDEIQSKRIMLGNNLENALNNEWKDGLLLEINTGITQINGLAQKAVTSVLDLKNHIEASNYKEMFSFPVYHKWIKKQIISPLEKIRDLLMQNKILLLNTKKDIEKQIESTEKIELKAPLKMQLTRIEMQLGEIEKFLPQIVTSITKLES